MTDAQTAAAIAILVTLLTVDALYFGILARVWTVIRIALVLLGTVTVVLAVGAWSILAWAVGPKTAPTR
jgi:hypothetical protein